MDYDASRSYRQTQVAYLDHSTPLELLSDLSDTSNISNEEEAAGDSDVQDAISTCLDLDEAVDDEDEVEGYENEDEEYEDNEEDDEWINDCEDLLEGELRELAKEYVACYLECPA